MTALENLLRHELANVHAADVLVSGLEVFTGEGQLFGTFPTPAHRDGMADALCRLLDARDAHGVKRAHRLPTNATSMPPVRHVGATESVCASLTTAAAESVCASLTTAAAEPALLSPDQLARLELCGALTSRRRTRAEEISLLESAFRRAMRTETTRRGEA